MQIADVPTKSTTVKAPLSGIHGELKNRLSGFEFDDGAVLVQVPQVPPALIEHDTARDRGYFAYPPHGLFYLSAVFRQLDLPSKIVDLNYEVLRAAQIEDTELNAAWQNALGQAISAYDTPFICISFMFDSTYDQLVDVCEYIRKARPELCIAIGGVAATADPDRLLKQGLADFVFSNEGETPLLQFYAYIHGELQQIPPNIAFLDTAESVVQTPKITGGDVDWDIREDFNKIPLNNYHQVGSLTNFSRMRGIDVPYATIISRRGCRARCTFCSVRNFNGKSVRVRNSSSVVDEMVYLHDNMGVRHFNWLDDDLLYDRDQALLLFKEIAARLPGISWDANNGLIASAVTPELMEAIQDSGCIGFTVGLETGNAEILRQIKKPASLEKFRGFAKLARNYTRIFSTVNFILGLPEERFEQALDSFGLAVDVKMSWNNFFLFQPLKNTDMYVTYAGMDDGITEDELVRRGTTVNFNAARNRVAAIADEGDILSGYDVFDAEGSLIPGLEQRNEIWFTFNYIANFLRNPAVSTESDDRLRIAIRWFDALGQAYQTNPTIDCIAYYLKKRADDVSAVDLDKIRAAAKDKFKTSGYWQIRDQQFNFSSFLDNEIPALDERAQRFFIQRG